MYLVVTIIDTFYSSFLWLYIDTQKKASLNFVHGVLQGQTAPHAHPSNTDCNIDLSPHGIIQSFSSPLLQKISLIYYKPPRNHMKYPNINYISFQLKVMLSMFQFFFRTFLSIRHT